MCKEIWIQFYEAAIEELCEEKNIEWDEAEVIVQQMIDNDPTCIYPCYE